MIHLQMLRKSSQIRSRKKFSQLFSTISRISSQQSKPPSFGIAFDIDGVVLRGTTTIGGAARALRRLYDGSGGGVRETKRAAELSELLGVKISPSQVLQGHSPFKQLVNRFENELVVAVGKGEPAVVMTEYGFKNVISIENMHCALTTLIHWHRTRNGAPWKLLSTELENAALILREFRQHLSLVILLIGAGTFRTGGLPASEEGPQPPLYFAHDDLKFQGAFPSERFGMGAFRIALESVFNSIHTEALKYTYFGKPNPVAFKNAEVVLTQLASSLYRDLNVTDHVNSGSHDFQTLYMIGDNPVVDVKGARQAGNPWFSILTRTGVFKGNHDSNHPEFPANLVVDTVEDAVDFIMRNEHQIID